MSGTITISPTLIVAPFVHAYTGPSGINNAGTIIVNSSTLSYEYDNGAYQLLTAPSLGPGAFHAAAVNDEGTIVGSFINSSRTMVGVIDTDGYFTTLSVDHDATEFTAINDAGEAVGNFGVAAPDGQVGEAFGSFIDQNGRITILNFPSGDAGISVQGINDAGDIVGFYDGGGFIYADGTFTTVNVPGGSGTQLIGINNAGDIVGDYFDPKSELFQCFIDFSGTFDTVDFQGYKSGGGLTTINDLGQVAGFANAEGGYEFSAFTADIPEPACFAHGTRILTEHGEIPVESLRIGELVRTTHACFQPIKWIGTRTYTAPFCNHAKILPIRIAAGAIADGVPARDLFVSPGHAVYVDGVLIHAERLLNGMTITQAQSAPEIIYFHIELENHEIILAENCPVETYRGECFRRQFQNAATFSARYPGARAPENFAAPLLTHGAHLAAISRRLRARAGIVPRTRGPLTGYIDQRTPSGISGWALDLARPDEPLILDVMMGNSRLGRTIANIPRPDVAAAGYGAGNHGFEFLLPAGTTGAISVRRAADSSPLPSAAIARAA